MLNATEEAKFAELRDKSRELRVPCLPEMFIDLKVHDKNGVLVFDDRQRGHSWVRGYYNALAYSHFRSQIGSGLGAGSLECVRYDDGVNVFFDDFFFLNVIEVGTSDTAWSAEQVQLAALILDGTEAGNLTHGALAYQDAVYDAETKIWSGGPYRTFTNNSGSAITVKEAALVHSYNTPNMYSRDVLDPAVEVAPLEVLTVTFNIALDFSAID
ncbi:hypothetical protein KJ590_04925 [Patescibacteria group bacterium]|nr:hypothetical protein [Patescibacteria group bacterium]